MKATPEFKAWEEERGIGAGPSWQARLELVKEQAKAMLPPQLVPYSKTIAIVAVITFLLIVPMLFPLATSTKSSRAATTATATTTKAPSSAALRAPGAAPIPIPQKTVEAKHVGITLEDEKNSQIDTAALQSQVAEAKRAAAAAQEQQRQLALKLEEASKREAALTEETKRLAAAVSNAAAASTAPQKTTGGCVLNKNNLQKAFTVSGGGRAKTLNPPTLTTGNRVEYYLQYALYYLASLGPDVGLLTIEAGLLVFAAVLMLGLRKSRSAAEKIKEEYLRAYRREMALFAKAEEAYEAAYAAQSAAEKMALETREADSSEASAAAAAAAVAAAEVEALAKATAEKEQELLAKEVQLEKKVEEVKASAAAQTSAWAAAATQLLELAASSPNKNQPQKSRLSKSSTPPSPATLVTTVTDKYKQLRVRVTSAEAAATDAATVAETARQERQRSEQRVSEMITDNELLKERLSETKKALAVATDAKAAAELHEGEVRAALVTAQQNLATVQAEKEQVQKEAESLKDSLKLASEKAEAAVNGGQRLEAQIDQLQNSLGDESAQKQRAEQRCAQLEGDLSALQILADGLQNQVSALEQRLEESLAAQTELKFASKQLEAAHAAAIAAASAPTGTTNPALVQRALNEESAALERLTTAERRATEASSLTSYALTGGEDIAPRPALPLTSRSTASYSDYPTSPQQINSARASSLIARAGKIASMLSDGMDGLLGATSPPALSARSSMLSARSSQAPLSSARRISMDSGGEGGSLTARLARASELFSTAEQFLGQELPQAEKRPYRDIPLLLENNDGLVNVKVNGGQKESSAADEVLYRLIATGNSMIRDSESLKSDLAALGISTPFTNAAAERLTAGQAKVAAAVSSAEAATTRTEDKRAQHAALASIAREKQRALEDAQLALTAAMEEKHEDAIAAAAQHLQTAETAQQAASEAVYQAERDMFASVSATLTARDVLIAEQQILREAFATATDLVAAGRSGGGGKETAWDGPTAITPTDVFA